MTLLDSPASGLLIADEVGLGKTVEAGLIWTELRAREDMRRLLIVCPAMLREKWQDELKNRFGINAQIVDAKTLTEELQESSATGPVKAWITSYQARTSRALPREQNLPDLKQRRRPRRGREAFAGRAQKGDTNALPIRAYLKPVY